MNSRTRILLGGVVALAGTSFQATSVRAAPHHLSPSPASDGRYARSPGVLAPGARRMAAKKRATPSAQKDPGLYARGLAELHAGKYAAAQREFQAAIKAHDHVVQSYAGLGAAAIAQHNYGAGYKAYRQAANLDPKNPALQYRTAYAALYAEDYHAAVQYCTRYIQLAPHDWQGYHLRFLAYGDLLDRKRQIADAEQVVKLQPRSAAALNDLGIALANNRQYAKAVQVLTNAIKLNPRNPIFYSNRGQAEYQEKKLNAALADFQKARSLTKDPARRKQLDSVIAYLKKQTHR